MNERESIQTNHFNKEIFESPDKYHVSVFTPKNKSTHETEPNPNRKRIAVIVFPGAGDTAASSDKMALAVAKNLQKEQTRRDSNQDHENIEISAAIQMPSIIAKDVIDSKKDRDEILESFIKTINSILKDNPTDEIFLVGQSMGGQNLPELVSIIQNNYPDLKIAGTVFFQSGGLFEQKKGEFVQSLLKSNNFEHEISQFFPTKLDIAKLEERIRQAKEQYDFGLSLRLESDLKKMVENHKSRYIKLKETAIKELYKARQANNGKLPNSRIGHHKIEDIFIQIENLTESIDNNLGYQQKKQIKLRQKLIIKIINHLVSDPIAGDTWKSPDVMIAARKEAFVSKNKISLKQKIINFLVNNLNMGHTFKSPNKPSNTINQQITPSQTENFKFPVGVVWSQQDLIFPADKAQARTGRISHLFNKATQVYDGVVQNMGHKPHEFSPDKFGEVVSDIITRMKFDHPETQTTSLKY